MAALEVGNNVKDLEIQELESPGGIASGHVYGQLMGLYLLQNDTSNARYLWKRIPPAVKQSNPELAAIWAVGQKMWLRNFSGIYVSLRQDWSESIKPIMTALEESVRQKAFDLVAQAYSSIGIADFSQFLGLQPDQSVSEAIARGWHADSTTKMISPKKPSVKPHDVLPSEQQLSQLTDFVSFLEN
ncbi:PREDICTED: COP9 signalosome complex subunit 8-like [Priapulus caudatus]|uniref:COP9 signalosome complex subunit 8-like n=1 Tax=Priapulus caudatus TaxID=37621 RepID=A0ABM1F828_PRICU|nr:PREDICTED: COP9 signalosome complex subunit 8-like [Priapulus caudatus]